MQWLERFRQDQFKPVLADWKLETIIWDDAGPRRGKQLEDLATVRIFLLPYSPELNLVEWILEEIRRRVEGRMYNTVEAKQAAVETYLTTPSPPRLDRHIHAEVVVLTSCN